MPQPFFEDRFVTGLFANGTIRHLFTYTRMQICNTLNRKKLNFLKYSKASKIISGRKLLHDSSLWSSVLFPYAIGSF